MRFPPLLVLPIALSVAAQTAAAESTLFQLSGAAADEQYGAKVLDVGDVDADGVVDVAIGAPNGSLGLGAVTVISGAKGVTLRNFKGSTVGGRFGAALASADVTGDTRPDVLVGAPLAAAGGRGTVTAFDSLSGQPVWALFGQDPGDQFGIALAGLGDVNGDGIEDVAIGAVGDDDGANAAGSVRVVSGFDGSSLYTVFGTQPDEAFGFSLCSLEDLDGDGVREFAVGAPALVSPTSDASGDVHVLSGANGAILFSVSGGLAGDAFGRDLACVGDLDGDGFGDLLVGAPRPLGDPEGYARVVSSSGGSNLLQVFGDPAEMFGSSVAPAGDVDGDGVPDIAVGAPRDDELAADAGSVTLWSGATGQELARFDGSTTGALLGTSLAGGVDFNLDGQSDLVLGVPEAGAAGSSGQVLVASSSPLALAADGHLVSIAGTLAVAFELDAGPGFAGSEFALLGSVSGNTPGTSIGGALVPLNPDRYFDLTLQMFPDGPLQPSSGVLDASGRASAAFQLPPTAPLAALVGITFQHAFVVHDGAGSVLMVSNAVPSTIVL